MSELEKKIQEANQKLINAQSELLEKMKQADIQVPTVGAINQKP